MKKKAIYFLGVFIWWVVSSASSVPLVNMFVASNLFANSIFHQSNFIYSIVIQIPFFISHIIGAFFSGVLISSVIHVKNHWRIGLLLFLFGSMPFVILSSIQEPLHIPIAKLFISGSLVFSFGILGSLIGSALFKREHKSEHRQK